ncbi:hypothetical protein [Spiroplasma endosymbiont of Seladonia tumulorum]|uniref:hypothetical protein n=1 Tax=Spiroplasma endosymbiont of Seladonia tumulorum TaxID=3066321 RepID=UPI0030D5A314
MKKILAFLGTISIIPNVIPVIGAVSMYDKPTSLAQTSSKSSINKITYSYNFFTETTILYAVFEPSFWEHIKVNYSINSKLGFSNVLINRMFKSVEIDSNVNEEKYLLGLTEQIYDNWETINSVWNNSDKLSPIKIEVSIAKRMNSDWFDLHNIFYVSNYISATIQSN